MNFNATDCSVGGEDVCYVTGGGAEWRCDGSAAEEYARITVVSNFDSGTDYEAWGDIDGDLFCCSQAASGIQMIEIVGSDFDDILEFSWSSHTWNLDGIGTDIVGVIHGNPGRDLIRGSDLAAHLSEYLYGGDDCDTISAYAGNDHIYGDGEGDVINGGAGNDWIEGGADDDEIYGGPGLDTIYGNGGNDIIGGGSGNDTIEGGEDDDKVSGGDGDDIINGGAGVDYLCGDDGADTLNDGGGSDVNTLWGATSADELYCTTSGLVYRDAESDHSACGSTYSLIYSRPTQCPPE